MASPDTLEIRVFEVIRLSPFPALPRIIPGFPSTAPLFARILEPIKALMYAPNPPPKMGAFVMNPKPALL